jgi:chitinase
VPPPPPPPPLDEISVGDMTVVEGDSGTRPLVFPVTLSRASTSEVWVDYSLNWVTATGGSGKGTGIDFRASSGTLKFTPGATSGETPVEKLLSVQVYGDVSPEPDETFELTLSNPTGGYTLHKDTGTGTILDDDPGSGRRVSVGDASVVEGDGGMRVVKLPVTVSGPGATVRVPYSIGGGAAYGKTPASGEDFYTPVSGTLTFTGSEVSKAVTVKVYGDTTLESDESLNVNLGTVLGATVNRPTGTLTIHNDDTTPGYTTPTEPPSLISVGDVSVTEGDGGTRALLFPVTLSRASTSVVSVAYSVSGVTATGGTRPGSGVDFKVSSGILTFTPGSNSGETPVEKFVAVPVYSDLSLEPDETFELTLSNPTGGYSLGRDIGTGTIMNEADAGSGLSVGDATTAEGDAGVRLVKMPITLSAAPGATTVTMTYSITGGDAGFGKTPARNEDICMTVNGTVTFTGNEVSKTITVKVYGDTTLEPDETLLISVDSVTGATASRPIGTIIIHNDD